MKFYTYDDWIANAYSTKTDKELVKGQSTVVDLTGKLGWEPEKISRLNITSIYNPVYTVKSTAINPVIDFPVSTIDCGLGCLYKFTNGYSGPYESKYGNSGCVQTLDDSLGSPWHDAIGWPYMHIVRASDNAKWHNTLRGDILTINIEDHYFGLLDKILVFQSIYSGCITYQEAASSLEIKLGKMPGHINWKPDEYDYVVNTTLYDATSLMIVGVLFTFESEGYGSSRNHRLRIENISEFVYGHVDMAQRFGWNRPLWKTFTPPANAKVMPSSIMHYSKD